MSFLIASFFAGVLTVFAPCVFTLLPVILSGSAAEKNIKKAVAIIASLAISIVLFSLLLKGTTAFIGIPQSVWTSISGGLLVLFGITMVFPMLWVRLSFFLGLHKTENLMHENCNKEDLKSSILLGASLGPVFTTCSPTYAVILAIILPSNFFVGVLNLIAYAVGLSLILLLIAMGGRALTKKLGFLANPNGRFKKILGSILLITGIFIMTGIDKKLESAILDTGYFGAIGIEKTIQEFFEAK